MLNYKQTTNKIRLYTAFGIIGTLVILLANVIFLTLPDMWATVWAGLKEVWELWVLGYLLVLVGRLGLKNIKKGLR